MPRERQTRHILLLQGPVGPFFRRLANEFQEHGTKVTKVNFSPGCDLFFRGKEVVRFRKPMNEWPQFFLSMLQDNNFDEIFLFGDCRPMHKQAVQIAKEQGVPVWVFEEGYLRPDYITLEKGGVNGNSPIPKYPDFFRQAAQHLPTQPTPNPIGPVFAQSALYATLNALALTLFGWIYPHYRHHRNINAWMQTYCWVRSFFRKYKYRRRERPLLPKFQREWNHRYFFVPLQVHCDAQLDHSSYDSMEDFMEDVVCSFAKNAPNDALLVLKHHPHDLPYCEYTKYLAKLGQKYSCNHRIVYVHDLHLPTLLKHARGVVTMNSTVGTSALYHKAPVKALGEAVYDIPGLTFQGSLAEFFQSPGVVDSHLYESFFKWLRATNQINGSFYKLVPGLPREILQHSATHQRYPHSLSQPEEPSFTIDSHPAT